MKKPALFACWILATVFIQSTVVAETSFKLLSPNKDLCFELLYEEGSPLSYTLSFRETSIIEESRLGLQMKPRNGLPTPDWINGLSWLGQKNRSEDSIWHPPYGERSSITDRFNETIFMFSLAEDPDSEIWIIVRAYDEGVAFRYHFPERYNTQIIQVGDELTEFKIPSGAKGWFSPDPQGHYSLQELTAWTDSSERPLLIQHPQDLWVIIHEAEMVNFSRMQLTLSKTENNTLTTSLFGPVVETSPFSTPWRVIMVAEKPGTLLENNDLILNLNPASVINDTSWIRPGKVIREMTLSTAGAKAYADFAVRHGIDYIHFDAGWYGHEYEIESDATTVTVDPRRNPQQDLNLPEAIAYAKELGLGVIVYVNHRALERQLDTLLPLYKTWGIDGIKFGFVHVGSHRWTTWLHQAIAKCADFELIVNVHDEYRPTGFSRTYPNFLTMEGIRGNEEMPDATHNTVLPFTRFVAGPADYTICYYSPRIRTTHAHQLALSVIYFSPLQYLFWYDRPTDYGGEPEVEFFKHVPTVWDDTRVLDGKPGENVSIARRKGDNWFVGAITNNNPRTIEIPLDFLDQDKYYRAVIYDESPVPTGTRTNVRIREITVNKDTRIQSDLKGSSGIAIHLLPM